MAISVDPLTDIIYIPKADLTLIQASPEVREIDLNWFHLALKDWEDTEEAMPRPRTHNHNTEVSLAGLTYARIIEILDPYTVEFEDGQYTVNCVGANHNVSDKKVANQVSLIVNNAAGLITNAAIEYSSFNGGVTLDTGNISGKAVAGTVFPIGTPQSPSNNIDDAFAIAEFRGFPTFFILGDLDVSSAVPDLSNYQFIGSGMDRSEITIDPLATVDDCEYREATVTGTLDGNNRLVECMIEDLTYVKGIIERCVLSAATITLGGAEEAHFLDCWSGVPGSSTPTINMGGSGQALALRNYNGGIKLENKTGAEAVSIDLNSGQIILDSTVTNGEIVCRGIGKLTDNSTGSANVLADDLLNADNISKESWRANTQFISIDTSSLNTGTEWPVGSKLYPVNNLTDAKAIAVAVGANRLHINGSLTIANGEDISGYTIFADRSLGNVITVEAGAITNTTYFEDVTVSGVMNGSVRYTTCVMGEISNFDGGAKNCLLTGKITITGAGANYFTDVDTYFTGTNYIEISIGANLLNVIRCRGGWNFTDYTGAAAVTCDFASANVIIDATCVSGIMIMSGLVSLTDNSGPGCYVVDGTVTEWGVATKVWERELAEHTTTGTFGGELATKADIKASASTKYFSTASTSIVYGDNAAGSDANIDVRDGSYWQIQENATDGLTVEFTFNIDDDDKAGQFAVFGRYEGVPSGSHYMDFWVYNYAASAWELLVEQFLPGGNTSDDEYMHEYFERNIDRSNSNEVKIRLIHATATYNASHNMYLDAVALSSVDIITAEDVSDAVWSSTSGMQVLTDLSFVAGIEGGKWEISGGQMIFYLDDNTTEIARFNLTYDGDLNPIERTRV